jgi:hypothetical protein
MGLRSPGSRIEKGEREKMPQVTIPNGIVLGNGVYLFAAAGDPNLRTDVNVVAASVGSIYLRTDGGSGTSFYVKESSATVSAPSGTWTGK